MEFYVVLKCDDPDLFKTYNWSNLNGDTQYRWIRDMLFYSAKNCLEYLFSSVKNTLNILHVAQDYISNNHVDPATEAVVKKYWLLAEDVILIPLIEEIWLFCAMPCKKYLKLIHEKPFMKFLLRKNQKHKRICISRKKNNLQSP